MIKFYSDIILQNNTEINTLLKRRSQLSIARFFSFIIVLVAFMRLAILGFTVINFFIIVTFTFSFILFLVHYNKKSKRLYYLNKQNAVCENEIKALNGDFSYFKDGSQFIDKNHAYACDLDLFGQGSLFQMINRTTTYAGYKRLAYCFLNLLSEPGSISRIQECVKELHLRKIVLLNYQTAFSCEVFNENDEIIREKILNYFENANTFHINRFVQFILYVVPVLNILFIVALTQLPEIWPFFSITIIIQGIAFYYLKKRIKVSHHILSTIGREIFKYDQILMFIKNEDFKSPKLLELSNNVNSVLSALKKLKGFLSAFDNNDNLLVEVVFNLLLLRDIKIAIKLGQWKEKNQHLFFKTEQIVAEFEFLISLSQFASNNNTTIFPIINEQADQLFIAKDLGHPVIPSTNRINNSFETKSLGNMYIITGANMAGKSTFLRTIGVNFVLASIGSSVCASYYEFKPCPLFTSMRTTDSLGKNESYFYAEVLRLKKLKDIIGKGLPLLIIADELFSGTNSEDKQKASIAFIKNLLKYNKLTTFIATHDLSVTELEKEYSDKIMNYCFEIEHTRTVISYNYKIKRGITKSHNALVLLNQLGILD